jgi:hypothetical protein
MGIQDRDYWRDWKRQQAAPSSSLGRITRQHRPSSVAPWVIWIAVIFVGVIIAKLALNYRDRNFVPFPRTGQAHWYVGSQRGPGATFTVIAPDASSAQFVVKLDQWESKQPVVLIPVRGGESATLQVPLGLYRVTIVKGSLWQGPDKLFGIKGEAKEGVEPMSFHRVGNTIMGHTLRLETLAGNMQTRPSRLGY